MAWGAAVWEPVAYCSWQPGGMMPPPRVSDWEAEVIFISHFYIPQTLQFLRGGVLPCKIVNPRLFSHVFIQQALEGCSWVSFSSWVGSHGCFFHTNPSPGKRSQRDTPYLTDTWKSLCSVARSHVKTAHKTFQEDTSTDMGKEVFILTANFSVILKLCQNFKKI